MKLNIIAVPYDSGHRGWRMGAGPEHLLRSGLAEKLASKGHDVAVTTLETTFGDAGQAARDLAHQIAGAIKQNREAFPIILAGNCISTLGALAALDKKPGLLWFDAHADLNTPETSPSGFLDGMALSIILGRCYQGWGFAKLLPKDVMMLGVRSMDEGEKAPLSQLAHTLEELHRKDLYLHVDLDSLDPSELKSNEYATAGGLSVHQLHNWIDKARKLKHIVGMSITAYDPKADATDAGPGIVAALIERVTC